MAEEEPQQEGLCNGELEVLLQYLFRYTPVDVVFKWMLCVCVFVRVCVSPSLVGIYHLGLRALRLCTYMCAHLPRCRTS